MLVCMHAVMESPESDTMWICRNVSHLYYTTWQPRFTEQLVTGHTGAPVRPLNQKNTKPEKLEVKGESGHGSGGLGVREAQSCSWCTTTVRNLSFFSCYFGY